LSDKTAMMVEDMKASGFVGRLIEKHGVAGLSVAKLTAKP